MKPKITFFSVCKCNPFNLTPTNIFKGSGNTTAVLIGDGFAYVAFHYIMQAFGKERLGNMKRCAGYWCIPILHYSGGQSNQTNACNKRANDCLKLIHDMKPDIVFLNFQ